VSPPPRPGAFLWSIAGRPARECLAGARDHRRVHARSCSGVGGDQPGADHFLLYAGVIMNLGLLTFNILPIYPLEAVRSCSRCYGSSWAGPPV